MTYRDAPLSCPGCGTRMEERAVPSAMVDVCRSCKGIWVDWFDGELPTIAREIAPLSLPNGSQPAGPGACPTCQVPLASEPLAPGHGLGIQRCGECAGAFVPRESFNVLADMSEDLGPRASQLPASDPSTLQRLIALVRTLLGLNADRRA